MDTFASSLSSAEALIATNQFVVTTPGGASAAISDLRNSFRQGFVFEIYDLRNNQNIENGVFVLPLNPTKYDLSEPFQQTLTPTAANTVSAEENGIITRDITIEGTFGLSEKRAAGFQGVQGNGQAISGTAHFNAFRNFFRAYSILKKDPETSAHHIMIFHVLGEDDHFVVVPRVFTSPRDASKNRVHFEYRIQLTTIGDGIVSGLVPVVDESEWNFTDALRDINEAFNDGRAAFAEITANLSAIRRKVANIQTVLLSAGQILNAVGGLISGATDLINLPLKIVATTTDSLATAGDRLIDSLDNATFGVLHENARSIRRLESSLDHIAMYGEKFENTFAKIEAFFEGESAASRADVSSGGGASAPGANGSGGTTIGTRTRTVGGSSGRLSGLVIPRESGLSEVLVRATDSIESIATKANTTPEAIVVLNDLRAPYIASGGGPGILAPGDTILVPSTTAVNSSTGKGLVDFLSPEEALYGIDLALDRKLLAETGQFDIAVSETGDSLDAELVGGVPNIVQGTEITVNIERGETTFLPDIGIRRNVGTKGTTQHVLMASIILREALLADSRVSGIESSNVVYDGSTGLLTQEITPIVSGQRSGATLVLPFGSASEGNS